MRVRDERVGNGKVLFKLMVIFFFWCSELEGAILRGRALETGYLSFLHSRYFGWSRNSLPQ